MCDLQIGQLESEFGFGTSVDGFLLTYNQEYRDTFLDNFAVSIYIYNVIQSIPGHSSLRLYHILFDNM